MVMKRGKKMFFGTKEEFYYIIYIKHRVSMVI